MGMKGKMDALRLTINERPRALFCTVFEYVLLVLFISVPRYSVAMSGKGARGAEVRSTGNATKKGVNLDVERHSSFRYYTLHTHPFISIPDTLLFLVRIGTLLRLLLTNEEEERDTALTSSTPNKVHALLVPCRVPFISIPVNSPIKGLLRGRADSAIK